MKLQNIICTRRFDNDLIMYNFNYIWEIFKDCKIYSLCKIKKKKDLCISVFFQTLKIIELSRVLKTQHIFVLCASWGVIEF